MLVKEGELHDRIVREQVAVPEALTLPCRISAMPVETYGESLDIALAGLSALIECDKRMTNIRNLGID